MRTIHEAFWRDKRLAKMADSTRLIFVGIWMLADDAGWIDWDIGEMAAQLFPWMNVKPREEKLDKATAVLITEGRIVIHNCGHAEVPKLHIYQRPGRPYYAVRDLHRTRCNRLQTDYNQLQRIVPSEVNSEVKGSEVSRGRTRRGASARGGSPSTIGDVARGLQLGEPTND